MKVKFEFYSGDGKDHKELFMEQVRNKCPDYFEKIKSVASSDIDINNGDFYSYALFEDFNSSNPQFNCFKGFNEVAKHRKFELDSVFELNGSLRFRHESNTNTQICYAGCGLALSISNTFFGLTNADYVRIPEKKGRPPKGAIPGSNKTLDFEYLGSDGSRLFLVECKGKEGTDGSIDSKANDIIAKKNALPVSGRDLCFGIIGIVPILPDTSLAKCILVDPDFPENDLDPLTIRVYARLKYYIERLTYLGRPRWIFVLYEYVTDMLLSIEDSNFTVSEDDLRKKFTDFIGVKLQRPLTNSYYFKLTALKIASNKTFFCHLFHLADGGYFVYGFNADFFYKMENGTLRDFLNYKTEAYSIEWEGQINVWEGYLNKKDVLAAGELHLSSTGEIVGVLHEK